MPEWAAKTAVSHMMPVSFYGFLIHQFNYSPRLKLYLPEPSFTTRYPSSLPMT